MTYEYDEGTLVPVSLSVVVACGDFDVCDFDVCDD